MDVEMVPLKLFVVNGIDSQDAQEIPDDGSLINFEGKLHINNCHYSVDLCNVKRDLLTYLFRC